jgi:hypothetical protein
MVHELHKLGHQRLRVVPTLGPLGAWRLMILPASHVTVAHGAWGRCDVDELRAFYTDLSDDEYFGWTDAKGDTADALARKFVERFPALCRAGRGRDWCYAGWYLELLQHTDRGELPCVGADGMPAADPRFLPTLHFIDSGLPMPPGGELPPGRDHWLPQIGPLRPDAPVRTIPFSQDGLFEGFKSIE